MNLRKSALALLDLQSEISDSDGTKVVYIIRHGEKIWMPSNKTAYSYACESEQGWARAYNMPSVFGTPPMEGFLTPGALFSYNYDDGDLDCRTSRGYYRTQSTVAPLGQALGLEINNQTGSKPDLCGKELGSSDSDDCHLPSEGTAHDFGPCCNSAAASAMKTRLFGGDADTRAVLAAWEHAKIAYLVSALAGSEVSITWPSTQFDQVIAVYFDAVTEDFMRIDQDLYQGFEWIGPTEASTVDYSFGPGEHPDVN